MEKPRDFEKAPRQGEFKRLPADGYICKVMRAEETTSKNGKPMLKVAIDIADGGEYDGYFKKQFEGRVKNNPEATWPCVCYIVQINQEGGTSGAFKNFVECVRESNNGWEPAWGDKFCDHLKAMRLGVVFAEEEYLNNKGEIRTSVKPDYGHFTNIQDIREKNYSVPEKKKYEGNSFDGYAPAPSQEELPTGFAEIDEDDLPF